MTQIQDAVQSHVTVKSNVKIHSCDLNHRAKHKQIAKKAKKNSTQNLFLKFCRNPLFLRNVVYYMKA